MSKKRYVLAVILLALGYFLGTALVTGADTVAFHIGSEKMIYTTKDMPSYSEDQDFSKKQYSPLVRLESKSGEFFCSGTVISDDYVLTAAHCLMDHGAFFPGMTTADIHVRGDGQLIPNTAKAAALNQRADYALIKGDFRLYTKGKILLHPLDLVRVSPLVVTCGFPWGAEATCYQARGLTIYFEHLIGGGPMFPGMSGGPVVDVMTGVIFAVNSAVTGGAIIVSSVVGLFETLNVTVIQSVTPTAVAPDKDEE